MLFLFGSLEKRKKKVKNEKKNILSMICYYENEIKRSEGYAFKKSFPSEESYNKYVESLKNNLMKTHDKLIDVCHIEENLKKEEVWVYTWILIKRGIKNKFPLFLYS